MKCYSIIGNYQKLDGGAMFGNAPKALWSRWMACDELNRVPLACRGLLLQTASANIIMDVGIGAYMDPKLSERYGVEDGASKLFENLNEIGVAEDDIDYVIMSHMHFDHIGALAPDWPATKTGDWEPRFPNAKYVTSKKQYEWSKSPHYRDRASYIPELPQKLAETGRLVLIESEDAGLEGFESISFVIADGHTPGLLHTLVHGDNDTIFFASDMIPGTPWLHLPIVMGYDRFAEQMIDEKKKMLEQAVAENWLIFYTHDPMHAASRVRCNEKGKYEAVEVLAALDGFRL